MASKIRINLANRLELLELPGLDEERVDVIVRFRAEHGPIKDAQHLASVLGAPSLAESLPGAVDFAPAEATAAQAPGAQSRTPHAPARRARALGARAVSGPASLGRACRNGSCRAGS